MENKCPRCESPEISSMGPRTIYSCGSSDYDQRDGTFVQSGECKAMTNHTDKPQDEAEKKWTYKDSGEGWDVIQPNGELHSGFHIKGTAIDICSRFNELDRLKSCEVEVEVSDIESILNEELWINNPMCAETPFDKQPTIMDIDDAAKKVHSLLLPVIAKMREDVEKRNKFIDKLAEENAQLQRDNKQLRGQIEEMMADRNEMYKLLTTEVADQEYFNNRVKALGIRLGIRPNA